MRQSTHWSALLNTTGVYVVRFPDHVKVGRSTATWTRLCVHTRSGAIDATVFEVAAESDLRDLERRSTKELRAIGTPLDGTTESFIDITYDKAVSAVRSLHWLYRREIEFPDLQLLYRPQTPPFGRSAVATELGIDPRQLFAQDR